jgi:transposase
MTWKNRYYRRSRIAEKTFRRLIRYFALNIGASTAAKLTGISVRSVNAIYLKIRVRLAEECERRSSFAGEVEVDESYFVPRRVRGKCGRGAGSKTIVFGIFKRSGWAYTEIVSDACKTTLQRVIRGHVAPESVIHSDGWRGYHGLVDMGYVRHFRVHHGENEFTHGAQATSTALSCSGLLPSSVWPSSRGYLPIPSICTRKRPSFASTTDTITIP